MKKEEKLKAFQIQQRLQSLFGVSRLSPEQNKLYWRIKDNADQTLGLLEEYDTQLRAGIGSFARDKGKCDYVLSVLYPHLFSEPAENRTENTENYSSKLDEAAGKSVDEAPHREEEIASQRPKTAEEEVYDYVRDIFRFAAITPRHQKTIEKIIKEAGTDYEVFLIALKSIEGKVKYKISMSSMSFEEIFYYAMAILQGGKRKVRGEEKFFPSVIKQAKEKHEEKLMLEKMYKQQADAYIKQCCEEEITPKAEFVSRGRNPYLDNPLFAELWDD